MGESVWVLGASMTKISRYPDKDVIDLAAEATFNALDDAGVSIFDIQVLAAGSMFNMGGIGQQVAKQVGQMGLLAGNAARGDANKFEPEGRYGGVMPVDGWLGSGTMPAVFGQAGMEYAYKNDGVGFEQFAKVAQKNHEHSALNPLAQYNKVFTLEEIMDARVISYPNTLPMCCPTGDGAAAIVLVSESQPGVNTLTRNAADKAYELSGVGPEDLDLVELHDCFATAELIHYDNLRLCEPGGAGEFIDKKAPWRDGTMPVNVSGGLLSKGHPIGMTGAAGVFEITTQLRGEAGDRQIEGAKVGMAHVIGLGSSCGIHILEKAAL